MSATPTPEAATAGSRFPSARANRDSAGSGAGTRGEGTLEELECDVTVGRSYRRRGRRGSTCPPRWTLGRSLLLVALDDLWSPCLGGVRVAADVAQGASLAEQVPALVEGNLDL